MAENGISWRRDAQKALDEAKHTQAGARRLHRGSDVPGCARLEARGVPDERVVQLVTSPEFLPFWVHVRDPDGLYARVSERLNVHWTPTVLILDHDGVERHRIEGFLPLDDFLAQVKLGLAKSALQRGALEDAERRFREVVAEHPQSDPAPEALVLGRRGQIQGQERC